MHVSDLVSWTRSIRNSLQACQAATLLWDRCIPHCCCGCLDVCPLVRLPVRHEFALQLPSQNPFGGTHFKVTNTEHNCEHTKFKLCNCSKNAFSSEVVAQPFLRWKQCVLADVSCSGRRSRGEIFEHKSLGDIHSRSWQRAIKLQCCQLEGVVGTAFACVRPTDETLSTRAHSSCSRLAPYLNHS